VALGEALYKDIYEALRSSPQWNETLFIVTYSI
jgi:phospholipase C